MFSSCYDEWNKNKIKGILDYFGKDFFNLKRVLDLGCGHGDIGAAFARLGSNVTLVDGRKEHVLIAQKKYPGLKTIVCDLEREWVFGNQKFDLVLDLGIGCHLKDLKSHINSISKICNFLVFETAVADTFEENFNSNVVENKLIFDQSINGIGSRPSAGYVESILTENNFTFERLDNSKFNGNGFNYDWNVNNNKSITINKRRIWFAKKSNIIRSEPINLKQSYPSINEISSTGLSNYSSSSSSPRVALCLSGHIRGIEATIDNILEYIVNCNNCDVFLSTWDTQGSNNRFFERNTQSMTNLISFINTKLKPKKIDIEQSKQFDCSQISHINHESRDLNGVISMFYKINRANNIKKEYEIQNNFKYDYVIRYRPDLKLNEKLIFSNKIKKDVVYFSEDGHYTALCDQSFFGSSEVMDFASDIYNHFFEYSKRINGINPERFVLEHLKSNNVPFDFKSFKPIIIRSNGLVQDNFEHELEIGMILDRSFQGYLK